MNTKQAQGDAAGAEAAGAALQAYMDSTLSEEQKKVADEQVAVAEAELDAHIKARGPK